jgi:hypothetical protein
MPSSSFYDSPPRLTDGMWTKDTFVAWCNRRINSGQWDDPYVLVPLDGLKVLIEEASQSPKFAVTTAGAGGFGSGRGSQNA